MDSDALVGSLASHPETKQQLYGSGSGSALGFRPASGEDDSRRWSKQSKTDDFSSSNAASLRCSDLFSLSHAQTLSFSSPNTESLLLERSCSSASARNTGYSSGSMNCGGMYGGLAGIGGPFTPSQWMELEHQALIYKYIAANVAVPSNLLIPIGKALDSAGLSGFPAGFLRPNASGWGAFHVGFSGGNSDSEPRRCCRTDGKKWRCGRDAVADQKYCERHINRGRHRSRKPVEGQAGQSVAGISNNNIATTPKLVSSSTAAAVDSGAGFPNYIVKNLTSFHPSGSTQISRMSPEKDDGGGRVASCFSIPKPQMSYEASPQTGFGLVSGDKNPLTTGKSLGGEGETESRLHHFLWSGVDAQSERTQLSISTAMDASDLRWPSSSAAPANEKLTLSPLRLSKDFDPIQMGLGVSNYWVPIAWGSSMGGPLGEVLNHRNNNGGGECEEGGSSPTGVLQKSSFGSVSTGSAGSSPRAEKKNRVVHEGGRLCNDLLGQLL